MENTAKNTIFASETNNKPMKLYNFDNVIDRHGTSAIKIEHLDMVFGRHDVTPLWIADLETGARERIDTGEETDQYIPRIGWTPDGRPWLSTGCGAATALACAVKNSRLFPVW